MRKPTPAIDRFNTKYVINDETGCWEWTGALSRVNGYPSFWWSGKSAGGHRFSFEFFVHAIPDNFRVCHRCDNPKCVNPDHLFVGSDEENVKDKVEKQRQARGERVNTCKLDEASVLAIREMAKRFPPAPRPSGVSAFLSRWFGVRDTTISAIISGKNWKHLGDLT